MRSNKWFALIYLAGQKTVIYYMMASFGDGACSPCIVPVACTWHWYWSYGDLTWGCGIGLLISNALGVPLHVLVMLSWQLHGWRSHSHPRQLIWATVLHCWSGWADWQIPFTMKGCSQLFFLACVCLVGCTPAVILGEALSDWAIQVQEEEKEENQEEKHR